MKKFTLSMIVLIALATASLQYGMDEKFVGTGMSKTALSPSIGLRKSATSMKKLADFARESIEEEQPVTTTSRSASTSSSTSSVSSSTASASYTNKTHTTKRNVAKTPVPSASKEDVFWKALQLKDTKSALMMLQIETRLDLADATDNVVSLCIKNQLYEVLRTILADDNHYKRLYPVIIHLIQTAHKNNKNINYFDDLLKLGLDVNKVPAGQTSLLEETLRCCRKYNSNQTTSMLLYLVKAGASVDSFVQNNDLAAIQLLLIVGADPTALFEKAFEKCTQTNDPAFVPLIEFLLKSGASINTYVKANEIKAIVWLIEHGAQLNLPANIRLLHSAALRNYHEMVDLLLSKGIDPTKADSNSDDATAIYAAALYGHIPMVQKLLKAGVPPYKKGSSEEQLMIAVQNNDAQAAHALLEPQNDTVRRATTNLITEKGEHILTIALKNRNVAIIIDLLNHNCALNYLVAMNNVDAVDTLLALKAEHINSNLNQEATDLLGVSLREHKKDRYEMIRLLLFYGASIESLVFDENQNIIADNETMELLLSAGAANNADIFNGNRDTLNNVHQKASGTNNEPLSALLDEFKNTNAAHTINETPFHDLLMRRASIMHIATSLDTSKLLRLLIGEHPELINIQDKDGNTSLHYAAQRNTIAGLNIEGVKKGKQQPQSAEEQEKEEATFLAQNTKEIIELLVRAGANINAQNHNGDTPLMLAVKQSSLTASRALLTLGANPYIANNHDETPISIAHLYRHEDIIDEVKSGTAGRLALLNAQSIRNCCVSTCSQ